MTCAIDDGQEQRHKKKGNTEAIMKLIESCGFSLHMSSVYDEFISGQPMNLWFTIIDDCRFK